MLDLNEELTNGIITLKRPEATEDFAKQVFDVIDGSREHLSPWVPVDNLTSVGQAYKLLKYYDYQWSHKMNFFYAIFEKEKFAGFASVDISKTKCLLATLGCWTGKDFIGKGYSASICQLLETELFDKGVDSITIRTDETNIRAQKGIKKSGYTHTNTIKRYNFDPNKKENNLLVFSKYKQSDKR